MTLSAFALSLGLTLLLELPVAWLWGLHSRHDLTVAVLVNVLTNPAVVLLNGLLSALGPWWAAQLSLEAAAVAAEGFCYRHCGENVRRPYLLALTANCISYGMGLALNAIF
ncbi:hypothetical protein [Dysosmobacter sp.]|uniref:hypothetical protein n=1 Tax=Dysosmobacter sp. TaxID=2591382 RepID=UPI002A876DF3|nr:hypothetical protein [Dysosmobacter sp.]MDY3985387.1 hypothetical protein [Dysosmobacter sp.]